MTHLGQGPVALLKKALLRSPAGFRGSLHLLGSPGVRPNPFCGPALCWRTLPPEEGEKAWVFGKDRAPFSLKTLGSCNCVEAAFSAGFFKNWELGGDCGLSLQGRH